MTSGLEHRGTVVCVPRRCGLNDLLVQVWLSYEYARRDGRELLIDARASGLWDDLDAYLEPLPAGPVRITAHVDDTELARLNRLTCHPAYLTGRIDLLHTETRLRMQVARHPSRALRVLAFARGLARLPRGSRWPVAAAVWRGRGARPAREPRSEAVVVHHDSGGGEQSLRALALFRLTPELAGEVERALRRCGDDYDAIHVRNTDLPGDVDVVLAAARASLAGRRVLVCSDDAAVIARARSDLRDCQVVTVTETEDTAGRPLHKVAADRDLAERRRLATAQFVDLMALAHSRRLLVAPARGGGLSGYSRLAQLLHGDPALRAQLLRRPATVAEP